MAKIGFLGFGEVNTPVEAIISRTNAAADELEQEGLTLLRVLPVTDDAEEKDVGGAIEALKGEDLDALVLCVGGWIPTHAVVKITEHYRHLPMVLWGLCGWMEDGRIVTTADQAGTTALRGTLENLGYTFSYYYNIIGRPSRARDVADYCKAASAARALRHQKAGMAGYRDMNLYGTLYDGTGLKRVVGPEIETFEMLEMHQRAASFSEEEIRLVVERIDKWHFTSPCDEAPKKKAAVYYLATRAIAEERGYKALSLKDVDGMKKLLGFPPAPVFMLLAEDGYLTVPENDALGCVTLMLMRELLGGMPYYLEFYEFFEDGVLAGVPDYVPPQVTDGEVTVMPAAFGLLDQGILNVSKVKTGTLTMCRLFYQNGKYKMHLVAGEGVTPPKWEEYGWAQPAPQLPSLKILLKNTEDFAQKVACQHYVITYGDNRKKIENVCSILGIEVIES